MMWRSVRSMGDARGAPGLRSEKVCSSTHLAKGALQQVHRHGGLVPRALWPGVVRRVRAEGPGARGGHRGAVSMRCAVSRCTESKATMELRRASGPGSNIDLRPPGAALGGIRRGCAEKTMFGPELRPKRSSRQRRCQDGALLSSPNAGTLGWGSAPAPGRDVCALLAS